MKEQGKVRKGGREGGRKEVNEGSEGVSVMKIIQARK